MDLGANGIAIGATCPPSEARPRSPGSTSSPRDPRAAESTSRTTASSPVDRSQDAQVERPEHEPRPARHIELFQQVARGAKPVAWPAGGYRRVTETLGRAYDAVAFETDAPEDAADQFAKPRLDDQVNKK